MLRFPPGDTVPNTRVQSVWREYRFILHVIINVIIGYIPLWTLQREYKMIVLQLSESPRKRQLRRALC